jgi:hypothetical protein
MDVELYKKELEDVKLLIEHYKRQRKILDDRISSLEIRRRELNDRLK